MFGKLNVKGASSFGSGQRSTRASVRACVAALVCAAVMLAAPSAFAKDDAADMGREGGLGVTSAVATLIYGPLKVVYALGGVVVGGFAWAFTGGDTEVASTVFTRSIRGTYVITPEILLGEKPLQFIGREPQVRAAGGGSGKYADATTTTRTATAGPAVSSAPRNDDAGW
jgi:hypothetical protein